MEIFIRGKMLKYSICAILLFSSIVPNETPINKEEFFDQGTGIKYKILKKGPGRSEMPKKRDLVSVKYSGWLDAGNGKRGKKFDSSGSLFKFNVEMGHVIPGFDWVVQRMKVGDKVQVWIPYKQAYGAKGAGAIPPNSNLIFEIELVELKPNLYL